MPSIPTIDKALAAIKTDESLVLGLNLGSHQVTPGLRIPKAEARDQPEISFTGPGTYLAICLDTDAPFPSAPFLSPILHWLQPDLKTTGTSGVLESTSSALCSYGPPGPPPISSPHRYIFLLFEQPADFDVKKYTSPNGSSLPVKERMRYDFGAFEKGAKLGPVVAANFFTSN